MVSMPENETEVGSALVELEPGLAVLYGDVDLPGVEIVPFQFADPKTRKNLAGLAEHVMGGANVAAQGAQAGMEFGGIIRLAPETLKALKAAEPIVKDGWNLGVLRTDGKFAHQVRWLPAEAANSAQALATVGPAVALVAIQQQLGEIASLIERNIALSGSILETIRAEQWARIIGVQRTIKNELDNARHIGDVTDSVWENVRGIEHEVEGLVELFNGNVQRTQKKLAATENMKERRDLLLDHGEAIVGDVQGLINARASWYMYTALRAGNLALRAHDDPKAAALMNKLITEGRERYERELKSSAELLDSLRRQLGIAAETGDRRHFRFGPLKRATKDVDGFVDQLQEELNLLLSQNLKADIRPVAAPAIAPAESDRVEQYLRVLQYVLEPGETLIGIAEAKVNGSLLSRWISVTDQAVRISASSRLMDSGLVEEYFKLDDIRYVRPPATDAEKDATVGVFTKDDDFTLSFSGLDDENVTLHDVGSFARLLGNYQHQVLEELPRIEVPELVPPTSRALLEA